MAKRFSTLGRFPTTRLRRNRREDWSRRLVAEHRLSVDDLIWPVFVQEGKNARTPVASMPGVDRLSVDLFVEAAKHARDLGIPAIAIFPETDPKAKTPDAREAYNPDNLVCRAIRAVKKDVKDIGIVCDVALDPFNSDGHDGIVRDGIVLNDESVEALVKQAIVQTEAGADIQAPSDMMDGRIGAIRKALDDKGYQHEQIMSYAAKYASAFYNPFRDAIGSSGALKGDKKTYQMDYANSDEALREVGFEARPALSRHRAAREGCLRRADLRLSGERRVRDAARRRRARLARLEQGADRDSDRLQTRGLRRHPDLRRHRRGEAAQGQVIAR
jgi:porphobilinogen synthase